eukprot:TRINITY_DN90272_c0_g1_i1.p1 TRINITY_DN90272_c0_g1~~TRINITY_DN90272_c0_g1_i1.p1  ORF type:complete len:1981 (+),score=613.44 TRINITY_DN90272_c0_g1_i1:152-5944(+)
MDILVSIVGSKNLSQSTLITRSLYCTLQVGGATHRAAQVEAQDVPFTIGAEEPEALIVTLRNGQTQTAMYIRNVPLSLVRSLPADSREPVTVWLTVYTPSDPKGASLGMDEPPKGDVPQIEVSLKRDGLQRLSHTPATLGDGPKELSDRLRHTRERLEEELEQTRQRAAALATRSSGNSITGGERAPPMESPRSARASMLARQVAMNNDVRDSAARAQEIKSRMSALQDAKKQASSGQQRLQDIEQDIEETRRRVAQAEEQLQTVVAAKHAVEREKQDARTAVSRARETLRLREAGILELKGARDQLERQLSEAFADRERERSSIEGAKERCEVEVLGMRSELARWQAEEQSLQEALQRCDERVVDLRKDVDDAVKVEPSAGRSAEASALQQQLDEALAEMSALRSKRDESQNQIGSLQSSMEEAQRELAEYEVLAEVKRRQCKEFRAEAGACENELIVQMGRVAQLEGQVGENKNQLKDLIVRVKDAKEQLGIHESTYHHLDSAISALRKELGIEESRAEKLSEQHSALEERRKTIKEEMESRHQRTAELMRQQQETDMANTHRLDKLGETRQAVSSEIGAASMEHARLQDLQSRLQRDVQEAEAEMEAHLAAIEEAEDKVRKAERELEEAMEQRQRRSAELDNTAAQVQSLESALEGARQELVLAEMKEAQAQEQAGTQQALHKQSASDFQGQLDKLRGDLEARRRDAQRFSGEASDHNVRLDAAQAAVEEKRQQMEKIKAELDSRKQQLQSRNTSLEETRRGVQDQRSRMLVQQEGRLKYEEEMRTIASEDTAGEAQTLALQTSLEVSRLKWREQSVVATGSFDGAERKKQHMLEELRAIQKNCEAMAAKQAEIDQTHRSSGERLADVRQSRTQAQSDHEQQLRGATEELAELEKQSDLHDAKAAGIDSTLATLETEAEQHRTDVERLSAGLEEKRTKLREAREALGVSESEHREAEERLKPALAQKLESLRDQSKIGDVRAEQLCEKLGIAEAGAAQAAALEAQVAQAAAALAAKRSEFSGVLHVANSEFDSAKDTLANSTRELELQTSDEVEGVAKRASDLQAEVSRLSAAMQSRHADSGSLTQRLSSTDGESVDMKTRMEKNSARIESLRKELQEAEDMKKERQEQYSEAEAQAMAAGEATARLKGEAGAYAQEVTKLKEQSSQKTSAHQTSLDTLRRETAEHEQEASELGKSTVQMESEIQAVRERIEVARLLMQEKRQQMELTQEELCEVSREHQTADEGHSLAAQQAEQELETLRAIEADIERYEQGPANKEQKLDLLQEQVAGREDALKNAETDLAELDSTTASMGEELGSLTGILQRLEHNTAIQAGHADMQTESIVKLDDELFELEGEVEALTMQLRDEEQRTTYVSKENGLMRQQVEGHYMGSLQDWAAEVHRVKADAEVGRSRDELMHWQRIAEDAEREYLDEVEAAKGRDDEVEDDLRQRLDELPRKLHELADIAREANRQSQPTMTGSVHAVPAPLHGLVSLPRRLTTPNALGALQRRKALVVGCNTARSHAPLEGCANDAWNIQCLLRQSLHYREDQVRCLVDGTAASCSSSPATDPTRNNILQGLQWLINDARPGDNLLFAFSGYTTTQPTAKLDSHLRLLHSQAIGVEDDRLFSFLVPADFADDLPPGFPLQRGAHGSPVVDNLSRSVSSAVQRTPSATPRYPSRAPSPAPSNASSAVYGGAVYRGRPRSVSPGPRVVRYTSGPAQPQARYVERGPAYRLVAVAEIRNMLMKVPRGCKVTILLDSSAALVPGVVGEGTTGPGHNRISPAAGSEWMPTTNGKSGSKVPPEVRTRWLDLPILPSISQPAPLDCVSLADTSQSSAPSCVCHCYSACGQDKRCAELPIEGVLQGAFTWAFVKSLTACHLEGTLQQHSKALYSILADLQSHFRWLDQAPMLQLGGPATPQDYLLLS